MYSIWDLTQMNRSSNIKLYIAYFYYTPPASPTRDNFPEKRNNESFKKDNLYSPSKSEKSLWKKEKESLIQEEEINSSLKNKKKFTLQEKGSKEGKNPPAKRNK